METGYEIEPERVGRTTDARRPAVVIAVVLVLVAAVLVKPWGAADPVAPRASVAAVDASSAPDVAVVPPDAAIPRILQARPAAEPAPEPTWPSAGAPSVLASQTAKQTEGALGSLVAHAGTWGIGTAGVGPRMLRDEPWSDWAAATPEIVGDHPTNIGIWPGTDLCTGFPEIYDQPTLVAVTTPRDVAPDRVLRGWWTDSQHVASLSGSVVQVSPPGNGGIAYLERLDQAPWPPGRYEFHVVAGTTNVALTVCLTRRG